MVDASYRHTVGLKSDGTVLAAGPNGTCRHAKCPLACPRALCYHLGMKLHNLQLIALLVLFFVLPSLFKLLGRYTLGSKDLERRDQGEDSASEAPESRDALEGRPEGVQPPGGPAAGPRQGEPSSKPIHPRWF
jgi:hypothetical protein